MTGLDLSLIRLTSASLVTFSPFNYPRTAPTGIFLMLLMAPVNSMSASSYGNPLSITSESDLPSEFLNYLNSVLTLRFLLTIMETVTL